jgi:hypothetical protein
MSDGEHAEADRVNSPAFWRETRPEGRHIFYEGDDPAAWIDKIRHDFGLDPARFMVRVWGGGEICNTLCVPDPADFIRHGSLTYKLMGPPRADPWPGEWTFTVEIDCPPNLLDEIYTSDEYGPMGS